VRGGGMKDIPKKGDISITGLALMFTIREKKAPEMSNEIT